MFPEPRRHRGHGCQLTRCSASRASTAWLASQPSGAVSVGRLWRRASLRPAGAWRGA